MSEYNKELSFSTRLNIRLITGTIKCKDNKQVHQCNTFSRRFDINLHYERKPSEDISFTVAVQW